MTRQYLNDDENTGYADGKAWIRLAVSPLAGCVRVGADGEVRFVR